VKCSGDRGQIAGFEAVPFGLLVFAVGGLLVAHTWAVVDAKFLATTAAREAARAYVEATSEPAALAAAERSAREAVVAGGRAAERLVLRRLDRGFGRCTTVTFEARYPVPAVGLPWRDDRPGLTATARHAEVVDPYRDGLPGEAACGVPP
jgi:hypothetical protein